MGILPFLHEVSTGIERRQTIIDFVYQSCVGLGFAPINVETNTQYEHEQNSLTFPRGVCYNFDQLFETMFVSLATFQLKSTLDLVHDTRISMIANTYGYVAGDFVFQTKIE